MKNLYLNFSPFVYTRFKKYFSRGLAFGLMMCLVFGGGSLKAQTTDLIISEYVEGSSSNKYIEIFNGTGASVSLSDYELRLFANGSSTPASVALTGTLANNTVIVYSNSAANIYLGTTFNNSAVNFNGDDAVAIWKISTTSYVDIFGRIGNDPGTAWTATGGYTTLDKTLRRKSTVCSGVTISPTGTGASAFTTLSTEWDFFPQDDVSGLGAHTATCNPKYWDTNGATAGVGGSAVWGTSFNDIPAGTNAPTTASASDNIIYQGTVGTVTLSGSQTVASHTFNANNYTIATSASSSLGGTIALGSNNLNLAPATSTILTLPGIISGAGSLNYNGAGTTIISAANTYTGGTTITSGSLQLGAAGVLADAGAVTLSGGTLSSLGSFSETMGILNFTGSSTIALGNAAHSLTFANSSGVSWSAGTLTITGWTGTGGNTGTAGKIFVGSAATHLTSTQLSRITFNGFTGTPILLSTGELVPPDNSPTITVSPTTLTGFTYIQNNGPSASQTYNVSAANLSPASGNINVAASANYDVSLDDVTYSSTSVNIAYTGGTLSSTTVYVRLKAGLAAGAYNSQTIANSGGTATTKNVTVSGTVTASSTSDIIEDGDAAFYSPSTENIPYISWQSATILNTGSDANGSIGVFRFRMRDGGATATDADALPTIFNTISFNYTGLANTIRTAAIFDGNTKVADVSTVNANSLVFNSLTNPVFSVADNGTKVLTLRVTFSNTVLDNQKLVYSVSAATVASVATSSQLTSILASSDNGANDRNRIEVTADRIVYGTQPTTTSVSTNLAAFTLRFEDVNGNLDFDNSRSVSITATDGGVNMNSSTPYILTAPHSGVITLTDVSFTSAPQTAITITATTSGLAFTNVVKSTTFDILDVTYTTNDYKTINGVGLLWGTAAHWQRWSGSAWGAPGADGIPSSTRSVYIYGSMSTNGSRTSDKIIIESGGILTVSASSTSTSYTWVKDGGVLQLNAAFTNSGNFDVENNGVVNINYSTASGIASIWNGIEDFQNGSLFNIQNWNYGAGSGANRLIQNPSIITANANGYFFGNLTISGTLTAIFVVVEGTQTVNICENDFTSFATGNNVSFTNAAANATIGGSVSVSAGQLSISATTSGNPVITINGDLTANGGNINLNQNNSGSALTTLNLKGDLTVATNFLLNSTDDNSIFNFSGSGDGLTPSTTQTLDIASTGATENRFIDFNIKSGAYLQLINRDFELGSSSSLSLEAGSTLDFNFNGTTALVVNQTLSASPSPSFSMTGNAKLIITHPNGIDRWIAASDRANDGNVQVAGLRPYSSTGIYHYMGKAPQQRLGDGILFGGISGKHVIVELDALTTKLLLEGNSGTSTVLFNELTDIGLSNSGSGLKIIQGTVVGTATSDFMSTGNLEMTGGLYQIAYPYGSGEIVPRLEGTYSLTGGTIELYGTTPQKLRGGNSPNTPNYFNLRMSGSNTVTINNTPIIISNDLDIRNTAIFDIEDNNMSGNATLTMTDTDPGEGGRLRTAALVPSVIQPALTGIYTLNSGVVEFKGSNVARQSIRSSSNSDYYYQNIEVTGTNVGHGSSNIRLKNNGSFSIKNGGTYISSDRAIESVNAAAVGTQFIMEVLSTLYCNNSIGFNSAPVGLDNASVKSGTNGITSLNLQANSTIIYSRNTPDFSPSGDQVITSTVPYQNLSIQGTGNKTAPSSTLEIKGNLTKTSTSIFKHNGGSVLFNGTAGQNFSNSSGFAMTFNDVSNESTGLGLVINSDSMAIVRKLALGTGSKLIMNSGSIILKSSDTATANVAPIPDVSGIIDYTGVGRFITERYIKYTGNWNLLTAPVAGSTVSQSIKGSWQEGAVNKISTGYGTQVTMPAPIGTGIDTISIGYSIKYWDPLTSAFVGVNNTETTFSNQKSGFYVFARGDRGYGPNTKGPNTTLRSKGKLYIANSGSLIEPPIVSHVFTDSGQFFPVANPFASVINFEKVYNNNLLNNFKPAFTLWDPTVGGSYNVGKYQAFAGTTGWLPTPPSGLYTGGSYDSIQSGQSFYLESDLIGTASVEFNEADKADGSRTVTRGGGPESIIMMSTMLHHNNGYVTDGNRVAFDNAYNKGFAREDAKKITNSTENFGIRIGQYMAIVEGRPEIVETDTIFYKMSNLRTDNYKLSFEPRNLNSSGLQAELIDNFLNSRTQISLTDSSWYSFTANSNAASKSANRFLLVFKAAGGPLPVTLTQVNAKRNTDQTITVNWKVEQEQQLAHYDVERSADGLLFTKMATVSATNAAEYTQLDAQPLLADNYYRIKAVSTDGRVQYSRIVKVAPVQLISSLGVYPNPVVKHQLQLQVNLVADGNYKIQLYNSAGQLTFEKALVIKAGAQRINIDLPKYLSKGNYRLNLNEPGGVNLSENILLQ